MIEEEDGGIDKRNVLSEIDGVPAPAPEPPPSAPPASAPARAVIPAPKGAIGGSRRRSKAAAIVTSVVALVWLAVGLTVRAWAPSLVGVAFGVAAVAVWVLEVWDGD